MERVLVIDDDVGLCELVKEYLEPEGYDVEATHNGERGIARAFSEEHALVVLDVMLPGINGFDVLRRIRSRSRIPVLMLTARGDDVDRIVGLEIGADDYLSKPFNLVSWWPEFAPYFAVHKSADSLSGTRENLMVGDIEMEIATARCVAQAGLIELTVVEYDLLEKLLRSAGQIARREDGEGSSRSRTTVRSQHRHACQQPAQEAGPPIERSRAHQDDSRSRLRLRRRYELAIGQQVSGSESGSDRVCLALTLRTS